MVSGNDPIESFFNSIELGFRKVAKDLECCFPGRKNEGDFVGLILRPKESEGGICGIKKRGSFVDGDKRKRGLFLRNAANSEGSASALIEEDLAKEEASLANCLQFAVSWSLLVNNVVRALPRPFKATKKRLPKMDEEEKVGEQRKKEKQHSMLFWESLRHDEGKHVPFECLIGSAFDQWTQNLHKFDLDRTGNVDKSYDTSPQSPLSPQVDHFKAIANIWEGRKAEVNGFFGNLRFARVGGVPSGIVGVSPSVNEGDDCVSAQNREETSGVLPQKPASGILSIPLSNVERLRSTLSTVSLTELIELLPQVGQSPKDYPDKKKLISVQDFFRYTEVEGRRFFEELDRDGDGQITMEDLEIAIRKRKLPKRYAQDFMNHTRSHIFSKSFGWKQFLSFVEQKEPTILRAYTSLCLSESGTLQKSELLASLQNAGLPANEDNAVAMMRFLNADTEDSISYGHFRNFMLLLPSDRLQEDPRSIWFKAATVVAVPPPVEIPTGSVLKSALAGGISCSMSTFLMFPIDTIKTCVQASTLSFPEIISSIPQIGVQGLYRGSTPAIIGQFSGHGLRTGIFEATERLMIHVAPTLPDIQVQTFASLWSTFLGTVVRIPSEVLKQRLQAGLFDNLGQAILETWNQDGLKGFFRGTGATLCREVPFYVAGSGLYAESIKAAEKLVSRELQPWETIAVGALSGGLTAVLTTPFDVMKTRMMITQGQSVSMSFVFISILRHEGPFGLFKGALPRFFWIAPMGAINFAGYELVRKAMDKM